MKLISSCPWILMELTSLFWTPTPKILQIYQEQWIRLLESIINTIKYLTWMTYSSSSWPPYVYWWYAHSRVLVFHALHREQRYTRICPLISYRFTNVYSYFSSAPIEWSFTSLFHSSPPSASTIAAAASRAPSRSIPTCSHQCIPARAPGALSCHSCRSNSYRVAMYCATVFYCRLI